MKKNLLIILLAILFLTACSGKDTQNDATGYSESSVEASVESSTKSSAASETAGATSYQLSIPKDFSELEIDGMEFYYAAEDGSSISLNLQPKDSAFSQVSAQQLSAALSDAFLQTYEEEVAITDNYFATEAISGFPAYQYSISYELQGTAVTQMIVGIDADQTYTFTYTDLAGTWIDIFEDSIKTITFINK